MGSMIDTVLFNILVEMPSVPVALLQSRAAHALSMTHVTRYGHKTVRELLERHDHCMNI